MLRRITPGALLKRPFTEGSFQIQISLRMEFDSFGISPSRGIVVKCLLKSGGGELIRR